MWKRKFLELFSIFILSIKLYRWSWRPALGGWFIGRFCLSWRSFKHLATWSLAIWVLALCCFCLIYIHRCHYVCMTCLCLTFFWDFENCRILSCFKLNPFEYLNISFDASPEDVKKQYRKVFTSSSWNYNCPYVDDFWFIIYSFVDNLMETFMFCSYHCWFTLTNASIHRLRRHLQVRSSTLMLR